MDKEKQNVLEEYVKFRRLRNHSDTINDIENHVKRFLEFSNKPLKNFDEKTLLDYLDSLNGKYSVGMLNNIKSAYLKNFIKWYFSDWSLRFRNLTAICKTEKTQTAYKPEDMISEEEFKKLIQGEESHFWKAYFMTLFYGGCRPVEVCKLKWKDIDFNDKNSGAFITIFSNKNKNSFIKYLPSDVAFYLKELQNNKSEWVFLNENTKQPISRHGAYWKIQEVSQRVLGHPVDLYTLRHSIATIIYNKDYMKDDDVARQMGHTKSMKGKYVHNNKDKLKETARKIYMSPEQLPPEKKHELEIKIDKLIEENKDMHKEIELIKQVLKQNNEIMKKAKK